MSLERVENLLSKFHNYFKSAPQVIMVLDVKELNIIQRHVANLLREDIHDNIEKLTAARNYLLSLQQKYYPMRQGSKLHPVVLLLCAIVSLVASYEAVKNFENEGYGKQLSVFCFSFILFSLYMHEACQGTLYLKHQTQELFKDGFKSAAEKFKSSLPNPCNLLLSASMYSSFHHRPAPYIVVNVAALAKCDINSLEPKQLLEVYKNIYTLELLNLSQQEQDILKNN